MSGSCRWGAGWWPDFPRYRSPGDSQPPGSQALADAEARSGDGLNGLQRDADAHLPPEQIEQDDDALLVGGALEQPAQAAQGAFDDVDALALVKERRDGQRHHALFILAPLNRLDGAERDRRRMVALTDQSGD